MHYTLLQGHTMFRGTRPFLQFSGVLISSPYVSPSCHAINEMFFTTFPKSLNPSVVARMSDDTSVP